MGKIDVYIYPFFCCKQYDGGDTFIGIYTSYTIYTVIKNKCIENNGLPALVLGKISSNFTRGVWKIRRINNEYALENNGLPTLILQKICHNFRGGQEPACILQRVKSILHYALCTMHHASCIVYVRSHCIELYLLYYTIIYYYILLYYIAV